MRNATVGDVYRILDEFAPFETALSFDNVGLLTGRMDRRVDTVITALDATQGVVAEARREGAQLLVTHHPLLFSPVQRLTEDVPESALLCDIIRSDLSLIAAHTNLDLAMGGVNDALAEALAWPVLLADGFLRLGEWQQARTLGEIAREASERLDTQIIPYGPPDRPMHRYALCSGAGGSEVGLAASLGAQVLFTGEIKHHEALEAMARGLCVLEAGHRATEKCAADLLARHLQSALDHVESRVRVFPSQVDPFG